jgi:hypothetical protein
VNCDECAGAELCVNPAAGVAGDGVCLGGCDPLDCTVGVEDCPSCIFAGAAGGCVPAFSGGNVVGFRCTPVDGVGPDEACSFNDHCRPGLACHEGFCRSYCSATAPSCPATTPTCTPISGDVGVCVR